VGARFVPIQFTPSDSTFKGQLCAGAAMIVTQREQLQSVDAGLLIATTLERLYPQTYALEKLNTLLQDSDTLDAIRAGKSVAEIRKSWGAGLEAFRKRRAPFLIYPIKEPGPDHDQTHFRPSPHHQCSPPSRRGNCQRP